MTLYIENPRDYQAHTHTHTHTHTTIWTNNSLKSQDTKSTYKDKLHFYLLTKKLSNKHIKKSISLTIATKTIKYLGTTLTKEMKELNKENYKTMIKKKERKK